MLFDFLEIHKNINRRIIKIPSSEAYDFKLINPGEQLFVSIKQTDKEGIILTAVQTGDKKEFNFKQLLTNLFKYPLMTIKIISAIHFEAFLLWKKGAIYRPRDKKIKNNLSFEKNS